MKDLFKLILNLLDVIFRLIIGMIPAIISLISIGIAYYFYKKPEDFTINKNNYFYDKKCRINNKNNCAFNLNNTEYTCPVFMCENKEDFSNYYCFDGEKCNKKEGEIKYNSCGYNQIGYTPYKIYKSEDECLRNIKFDSYNKDTCLKSNKEVGWFIDSDGEGKCVKGTPTGPNEITLNYRIYDGLHNKNTYQYRNTNSFII